MIISRRESPPPSILSTDHALLLLLLFHSSASASSQFPNTPPPSSTVDPFSEVQFDKSMAIVLVILVVVFFALGFLSVYSRQCAERRFGGTDHLTLPIGNSGRHPHGLDPDVIHTFPTFFYSTVKGLKIGRSTLECAVCLNEFQDHETLRFIPKCNHVFHPDCIDLWLSSHSTCPVCRANLIPRPGEISFVAVQIPDSPVESEQQHSGDITQGDQGIGGPSPKNRDIVNAMGRNQNPAPRSGIVSLFRRSHSTGHSLVSAGENRERFTLRLPEEVRKGLLQPAFTRMASERRDYRTRSVGSGGGHHEWFRNCSSSSTRESMKPHAATENLEERSTDRLCPEPSEV